MPIQTGLRRAHLFCVPPDFFSRDRDRLIGASARLTGNRYTCPADALPDILRLLGYTLKRASLPGNLWAQVCPGAKEILECQDLREKLRSPHVLIQVRHFTLAHELAHIRLHVPLILDERMEERHESEANRYAEVFLMPLDLLRDQPEWDGILDAKKKTSAALWELTRGLAESCRVSGQAMAVRLTHLGLLHHDPATRELRAA